jgi:anti-anti-sigma factor
MEPAQWPRLGDGRREIDASGFQVRAAGNGCAMVSVCGELDVAVADELFRYVREVIDRPSPVVLIDLSGLTFCDGRGLGCLVRIGNYAEAVGSRVLLSAPSPAVTRVLRLAKLDQRFAVVPVPGDPCVAAEPGEGPRRGTVPPVVLAFSESSPPAR